MFELSGWSQAELARQLCLTRGGVNALITGDAVPSLATVKLFELMLISKMPGVLTSAKTLELHEPIAPYESGSAAEKLTQVRAANKEVYEALQTILKFIYDELK